MEKNGENLKDVQKKGGCAFPGLGMMIVCVIVFCIPIIGPILGLGLLIISYRTMGLFWGIIGLVLMIFIFIAMYIPVNHFGPKALEAEVKANCHSIRADLERYAENNNGLYPDDISGLIDEGINPDYPDNPFIANEPMKPISLGAEEFKGNFMYVPVYEGNDVIGYYILGFGSGRYDSMDINGDGIRDHVILVLDSVADDEVFNLPPLEELLAR